MKNNLFLSILILGGLLSACSTTPAPSIYKGGQATTKPAPKVDENAPVVRALSTPSFKETPLEAKPLPAKPLNSYAPSAIAPSTPMAPGVDYVQAANAQVVAGTAQVNKGVAAASSQVNTTTTMTTAKLNDGVGQVNQAAAATSTKAAAGLALPAASLSGSPAARQLATSADTAMAQGDLTASAASLERALRIEPNNAGLWSRLAEVRLRQGDTAQAEQLALKANGLAGADVALRSRNDQIVAQARGR